MTPSFESWEQENWDREHRLERDEHREPFRAPTDLTRRPRLGGEVQPPVKTGGDR